MSSSTPNLVSGGMWEHRALFSSGDSGGNAPGFAGTPPLPFLPRGVHCGRLIHASLNQRVQQNTDFQGQEGPSPKPPRWLETPRLFYALLWK